jgi:hypothetical protein
MALVKDKTFRSGVELPSAYFRVTRVDIDKASGQAYITVYVYKDADSRSQYKDIVESSVYSVTIEEFNDIFSIVEMDKNGENPFKIAYKYLRSLPEFTDAIDV